MRVQRGTQRLLCNVPFREHHLVRQHVAVPWKQGVCPRTATSCFLMTDLGYPVQKLTALYGRRMTIEERFRDKKNRRHGSRVAEHPDQAAGTLRPPVAHPDVGLLAASGHRAGGPKPLCARDVVQQQQAERLRGVLHRKEDAAATGTDCRVSTYRPA